MVRKVAIIGAGASGAAAAAALHAEDYFDDIKVFERRETAGGTWIYDAEPGEVPITPGALPPDVDRPLSIPEKLPARRPASTQYRFDKTPIYEGLTTNVPDVAMSFSDLPFAYGPFVPHQIPRQYVENYFSWHRLDSLLHTRTTVEDITAISNDRWALTLRKYDAPRQVDYWWEEDFDAVVIANGHYAVPFVPAVPGLEGWLSQYPGRVQHSKSYRTPRAYENQRVLVIGNSASGYDVAHQLVASNLLKGPLYVSRRSRGRWDGDEPPDGMLWKPVISLFRKDGSIVFTDGSVLRDIDRVIYCTGYQASYPFWNERKNGGPIFDYRSQRILNNYQHTFIQSRPTLALIGFPRVLTFRSFEYQAVAIARLWSGRNKFPLPGIAEQKRWEEDRAHLTRKEGRKFHQIDYDDGETLAWFQWLYDFAGLPSIDGHGRCPPVLDSQTRWAIEHVKKYPEHDDPGEKDVDTSEGRALRRRDTLWFL
ncbi:Putative flavin monooxygenase, FAD/NAD(P)-binding domain superfamily [Septoria linicola]|uniref:Flavin monooxygenase, FAD/NAD(P)-binding domain superfamily n=1 Tax=Septoria linicola TaxID=215465 RepID=A0A9Q9B1M8_9PEZI|nr:Putative flavin monooxygenase, FAD/NAD(P)-binding domain superfamily [Septoria linicola]